MKITINPHSKNEVYLPLLNCDIPTQIIYGGSSSGKSYDTSENKILELLRGRSILATRQTKVSLRKSVFLELQKAITRLSKTDKHRKIKKRIKVNKTEMTFACKSSEGCIVLIGCDDTEKVKSITPLFADAFDLLWCEEATEISLASYIQLRLRMRGGKKLKKNYVPRFKKKAILTFNPIFKSHWIYKRWFKKLEDRPFAHIRYRSKKVLIMRTTYKDNKYLEQEEIDVIEEMKEFSPYHYSVYGLGEFGILGSRIYENWKEEAFDIDDIVDLPEYRGLDFGYTNDPTAYIVSRYNKKTKTIYIYDEHAKTAMHSPDIFSMIKMKCELWGSRLRARIWCDHNEPLVVKELNDLGLNCKNTKSKDILKGVDWLQQHRILVHPKCKNIIEELMLYIWEEKDGEPVNKPVKKHDHGLDALRYSYCEEWLVAGKLAGGRGLY